MKLVHEEILFGEGELSESPFLRESLDDVRNSIKSVVWPKGSRKFTINPTVDGNGVLPIKAGFLSRLKTMGWQLEQRPRLVRDLGPGKIDALKSLGDQRQFAAEWETGNISSSHRALNKMCIGILEGHLTGGVLILPDRELYNYLTQRVGNYRELAPYFPVYRNLRITGGLLAVFAVSHDLVSKSIERIPKRLDGNSLQRRGLL